MDRRKKAHVIRFYGRIGAELMELDAKLDNLYLRGKISSEVYLKVKHIVRRYEEKVERFLAEVEGLVG